MVEGGWMVVGGGCTVALVADVGKAVVCMSRSGLLTVRSKEPV